MANWKYVDFSVKEAQRLADLTGIQRDLEATEKFCDRFLAEAEIFFNRGSESTADKSELLDAFCTAAIVRYGRSFTSGVRVGVPPEVIQSLPQEQQESHRFFQNLRDKWVAHSVNAFEEDQVVLYLTPEERGPRRVAGVSALGSYVLTLSFNDMLRLKALAERMREKVTQLIEEETQKVLEYARSLLPDPFYNEVDSSTERKVNADVGKARKKW